MTAENLSSYRVLGVLAHPDDEFLLGTGTLVRFVEAGASVRLVYATDGEAGVDRRPSKEEGATLAKTRRAEAVRACAVLGIDALGFLALPDGALDQVDAGFFVAKLKEELRRFMPDLVMTLGPDGAYGHRDHLACTQRVVEAVADDAFDVSVLQAVYPQGVFARTYRLLASSGLLGAIQSKDLGYCVDDVDIRVDTRKYRKLKTTSLASHESQLKAGACDSWLPGPLPEALMDEEWFAFQRQGSKPLPKFLHEFS